MEFSIGLVMMRQKERNSAYRNGPDTNVQAKSKSKNFTSYQAMIMTVYECPWPLISARRYSILYKKRILNAYIRYDRAVEIRKEKDLVIIQINNRKKKTFTYCKLNDFNTTGTRLTVCLDTC
jgi:hypothetical protein